MMWATMRAEQAPDVYGGESGDQIIPRWSGSAAGDKDGDGPIGDTITLVAKHFPPGTKVTVSVPECPECREPADFAIDPQAGMMGACSCGFDWNEWARETFS